jgi:hypothetical protein
MRQWNWKGGIRHLLEETSERKKTVEKALIPLPPAGFVSFFCASLDVVQTNLQLKRAGRLYG